MNTELLHKYFAGEATPDDEKLILDWTDRSPDNYRFYLEERKRWNAFLVNYDAAGAQVVKRRTTRMYLRGITAVAACVVVVFMLSRSFFSTPLPEDKWHSVWVPPGQRARVVLDDGTAIWLNSQSLLSYPVAFDGTKRVVRLNGEGYFEVTKDPGIPFLVKTEHHVVEVLGTEFNVFAYDDYDLFETSLLSGSVRVVPVDDEAQAILLKPDQKVTGRKGALTVSLIDHPEHFRWKEGLLCFDDERFEDILKKFSIYFDINIVVSNPQLLDYRYTGKFRQSDGVEYALSVLQREQSFEYIRDNDLNEIVVR